MKKILSLLILAALLLPHSAVAGQVTSVDPEGEGNISLLRCAEKGNFDFSLFLKSIIYLDGFQEGVLEPWVDIIVRNQCHSADIYNLIKQQDALQTVIRRNYFTCSTKRIPQLRKSFNQLAAEIYYVRHVVDANLARSISSDILEKSITEKKPEATNVQKLGSSKIAQSMIIDRKKLYAAMYDSYVNVDTFEADEFDRFFLNLESKYKDRKYYYIMCDKGAWSEVSAKWDEFVKYWSGEGKGTFSEASKKFQKGLSARADALADEFEDIKTIELLKGDISLENYVESFIGVTINDLDPETFEEVFNEYAAQYEGTLGIGSSGSAEGGEMPATGSFGTPLNTISQQDALGAIYASQEEFDLEKLEKELQADFTNLYLTASDDSLEIILKNMDGRENSTEGLIEILLKSFPEMAKVLNGVKCVNDRQCSG